MGLNFVQVNLNHCRVAQDLVAQFMVEERVDVALLSDPYNVDPPSSAWHVSAGQRKAAIYVANTGVTVANVISDPEFVAVRLNGVQVYSCYASPNRPLEDFQDLLRRLEDSIRTVQQEVPVLVTGDLNARSAAWGDWVENRRGHELSSLVESLNLVTLNEGSTPTFPRGAGSIVDVTFASESLASRANNWRVLESVFNYSDHHYIRYSLARNSESPSPAASNTFCGWDTSDGIDSDSFHCGLLLAEWLDQGIVQDGLDADSEAVTLRSRVTAACNYALPPRRAPRSGKPPVHWWNGEINSLRAECVRAKRCKVRMVARIARLRIRLSADFDNVRAESELTRTNDEFREAKRQLKIAILQSKKKCWKELISAVDGDPFGKPYKLVMRKLRGPPAIASMEMPTLQNVISTLFPSNQISSYRNLPASGPPVPFTADEVNAAVDRARSKNKAPGPDCINSKILAAVHKANQCTLRDLFNKCLHQGIFPSEWKFSRVVLLRKGIKPEGVPSSYRPLCLLNDVGKMLEFLLTRRLEDHITSRGNLSPNQYGFRKNMSTDDAVLKLHNTIVNEVNDGKFCLAISLDIKNAFNTIKWPDIMAALESWDVPSYLYRMFQSYFCGRSGMVSTGSGRMEVEISGGVPQGSVVGPLLWNTTFDSVLRVPLPHGAKLLGFADDTLLVVSSKTVEELEALANNALRLVEDRISNLSLQIAADKTEAVLFTHKYKHGTPNIEVGGKTIPLTKKMTYLGMIIDSSLFFKEHMQSASAKAEMISTQLARIMPNVGGPREDRRRLLSSVVHSVLLYGAPSWAHTLDLIPGNVKLLNKTQRKILLRCTCAYRTVSGVAANVLASTPPADLLARERETEFLWRRGGPNALTKEELRKDTLSKWQARWDSVDADDPGSWTRRLIPDVAIWCSRGFGQVDFHLTQFLSGHGCFGYYLCRFKKVEQPHCVDCNDPLDNAEHAIFKCDRWWRLRIELEAELSVEFTAETATNTMLKSRRHWEAVAKFVHHILSTREKEERERQRGQVAGN
ncbi:unnamed protein product [Macrosiphum euphorbiae]|uniref:Reverse transcriptase domain-containing protein n=2 Tax=Macrosiphum euphorbiae TaxID=13131 RepID=A0AAV0X779_9HEMI|nr:unnamed protein product [Macrosiphum euphorbiae]